MAAPDPEGAVGDGRQRTADKYGISEEIMEPKKRQEIRLTLPRAVGNPGVPGKFLSKSV